MSSPPKEAVVVVGVEGVNLELGEGAVGGDAVADGVGDGDAAHGAGASVVEAAWMVVEVLAQAPHLRAIEEDANDQGHVDATFDLVVQVPVAEDSETGTRANTFPLVPNLQYHNPRFRTHTAPSRLIRVA